MQRICQSTTQYQAIASQTTPVQRILLEHCAPATAAVFAQAKPGKNGELEWWSPLSGEVIAFSDLAVNQQTQLLEELKQRQSTLKLISENLKVHNKSDQAETLQKLLGQPAPNNFYSINRQPVIINWNELVKVIPPALASSATANSKSLASPAIDEVPPPLSAKLEKKSSKVWLWLLVLLLLLLLLGLLFWGLLTNYYLPFSAKESAASTHEELTALSKSQLSQTTQNFKTALALTNTPNQTGRISSIACNPSKNTETPDFVTILDTSGSMKLNINISLADEILMAVNGRLYDHQDRDPFRLALLKEPTRETVAKKAYTQMIEQLHPAIATRLITFQGCKQPIDHGLFPANKRKQLLNRINDIDSYDGTPLGASLKAAAKTVDGVNKEALIIMFVDGEDGCGDNLCKISEQLARNKPKLQINVVDLSGHGLSNCAAELTNGSVYNYKGVDNILEINRYFIEAAKQLNQTCQ